MRNDDRAVSVAVGYVLSLGIATLLFSVLLIGGSGMIESQTRTVTSDELSVTGQQLAADLSGADRLVRAGYDGNGEENIEALGLRTDLPDQTAAGSYTINISNTGPDNVWTIELRSTSPNVVVDVDFRSETEVEPVTIGGGPVEVTYNATDGLVVESI